MRVLFAGSPGIAVPSLLSIAREHQVVGVLTNPEAAKGRGLAPAPTPVALAAAGLPDSPPVLAFEKTGAEARDIVATLKPDILVSFAYGRIFGPKFLALFPRGGINIHPSLLPRYRGCAPIPQAILNRDSETGVCVQRLALEMDCGEILARELIPLGGRETTPSLTEISASIGAKLVLLVLASIESGRDTGVPQTGEPSYCGMIRKEDGLFGWDLTSVEIDARVRAYQPWPGAYTLFGEQKLTILVSEPFPGEFPRIPGANAPEGAPSEVRAEAGTILALDRSRGIMVQTIDGMIAFKQLQLPTKKSLPFREFANGIRHLVGMRLGAFPPRGSSE